MDKLNKEIKISKKKFEKIIKETYTLGYFASYNEISKEIGALNIPPISNKDIEKKVKNVIKSINIFSL